MSETGELRVKAWVSGQRVAETPRNLQLGELDVPAARILQMPMNLADPTEGVALLHSQIREEDLDVCILLICASHPMAGLRKRQKIR